MTLRKILLLAAAAVLQPAHGDPMKTLDLMPAPARLVLRSDSFRLDSTFGVSLEGAATPRLCRAATRMLRRISDRTGLWFPQTILSPASNPQSPAMVILAGREGMIRLGEDESYALEITARVIRLEAETDIGAFRGLETVLQLLEADASGYRFPGVSIQDAPRFPWRGLLIDAGRHFMPVEVILRNLDAMAAVKLNVLHWHLTEDQGFRVECRTFPKLHELGSDGQFYSQEQIRNVVAFAADRGIRVVPEFDIPGHSTSWFVGYPELASAPGPYAIERHFGIARPAMDPTRESTYAFLDRFFQEMAELFPDEYLHIGGDEVEGHEWNENPQIRDFMKKAGLPDNAALQAQFNLRVQQILAKNKKRMVGWDEILNPSLTGDFIIQSWRGRESLISAAKRGIRVLLSNGYYIDLMHPAESHYLNDPHTPDMGLSDQEAANILGGEATMWSEFVTPETVDSRIWPRTAAIAERLWSPPSVRDIDSMVRRMGIVSLRLEELGLTHEKNAGMMLRRLCAGPDILALKTLVDVLEPVKDYRRFSTRPHTVFFPMTRVVDAARPDARVARDFNRRVEQWISAEASNEDLASLKMDLEMWKLNHARLLPFIRRSQVLGEIEGLSADLAAAAEIGLEALQFRETGQYPSSPWTADRHARLRAARQSRAEVELMVIDGIEKLLPR
jgi:hexosaminidase